MTTARRPLRTRGSSTVQRLAAALARRRVTPNAISVASMVFAALGAAAMVSGVPALLAAAAVCIQLRLLCNLIDGLVAVEGGMRTADGELFNEVPDRVSDSALLVAAGYACGVPELGWGAALAAALTAYVRALGGSLDLQQDFSGVMAKPQRMALLTAACLAGIFWIDALTVALGLIAAGSAITCVTRLARIRAGLMAR